MNDTVRAKEFSQTDFNRFVVDHGVIGFFEKPIILKSGRSSNWYVNWRTVAHDAFLLDQLSDFLLAFITASVRTAALPAEPDCIYGVPEGASKLAILTQYKFALRSAKFAPGSHIIAMGRGKPKEHGAPQDKFFVGVPQGKVVIVEDVTTTGGSLLTTIDQLIESDIEIIATIGLTNRMEKRDDGKSVAAAIGEKRSRGRSIPYLQMSSALELLPQAVKKFSPPDSVQRGIVEEFAAVGVAPLSL